MPVLDKTKQTAFLDEDFLLKSEFAKQLYHSYAKQLPIIDYHCHHAHFYPLQRSLTVHLQR